MDEVEQVFRLDDKANGISLQRYTVTQQNVNDLTPVQTAKAGTRYEIMPGKVCVARKATWGLQQQYETFQRGLEEPGSMKAVEEANRLQDLSSPFFWMNINLDRARILCESIGFTWDEVGLDQEGAHLLAIDVLQRIGNDFLFRTNALLQRQIGYVR